MLPKQLKLYGLGPKDVVEMDLRKTYMQQRPNRPFDDILRNDDGEVDYSMTNSPHYELARRYLVKGERNARTRFKRTKYSKMVKILEKRGFPAKFPGLIHSMKKGYLRRKRKHNYITVLMEPFASSRYGRKVPMLVPEVWSGHHRIGILLAMEQFIVPVMIAEDLQRGTKKCAGKIHDVCV